MAVLCGVRKNGVLGGRVVGVGLINMEEIIERMSGMGY